ncbi:MAG: type II secretion system protein GspM [Psychrobacter sp.]
MKRFQRRSKGNTASLDTGSRVGTNALSEPMRRYQSLLMSRWQALPSRDQMALVLLSVFLLLLIGGYGGYSVHQAAKDSKANYQEQVADYFWLRAQASNIDMNVMDAADGESALPPANSINALLNASGINNAQVVAAGDAVQLSFNHASQAVISSALGKLKQQGWQFTQLSMQQDPANKSIQVNATVGS